jgi:hypothetical protein
MIYRLPDPTHIRRFTRTLLPIALFVVVSPTWVSYLGIGGAVALFACTTAVIP